MQGNLRLRDCFGRHEKAILLLIRKRKHLPLLRFLKSNAIVGPKKPGLEYKLSLLGDLLFQFCALVGLGDQFFLLSL